MESKPLDGFYSYKFDGLDEEGLPKFKDIDEPDGISKEEMFAKHLRIPGNGWLILTEDFRLISVLKVLR